MCAHSSSGVECRHDVSQGFGGSSAAGANALDAQVGSPFSDGHPGELGGSKLEKGARSQCR